MENQEEYTDEYIAEESENGSGESVMDDEYKSICLDEIDFMIKSTKKISSAIESKVRTRIPESVDNDLTLAFTKAFEIILNHGTSIIGATLMSKGEKEAEEAIKHSKLTSAFDQAVTFIEGTGMGIIGLGLPDIPIFTAMIFRSIYQKAALYGFDYTTETEKVYMLKIITGALKYGKDVEKFNMEIDKLADDIDMNNTIYFNLPDKVIKEACETLSCEMLCVKFIQGMPIIGAVGGLYNATTINKISRYAEIKYHKRSYLRRKNRKHRYINR